MAGPEEGSKAWAAQDKGPSILIVCWLVTALSTLFVFARVYVRGWMQRNLQQDDWWIIIAMVCGYVSTSLSTLAVASGNGKHWALLTVEQQQGAILWTTAAFCPGVMSFGLPKMAVAYLLTKLLNPSKWHKYFLWWLGIWCQLTLFATVGVLIGRCTPARSQWDFSVKGECFDSSILVAYCIYAGGTSFPLLVVHGGPRGPAIYVMLTAGPQLSRPLSTSTSPSTQPSSSSTSSCPSRRSSLFRLLWVLDRCKLRCFRTKTLELRLTTDPFSVPVLSPFTRRPVFLLSDLRTFHVNQPFPPCEPETAGGL